MGEVCRARDPRLEREVAVKVLPDHSSHPEHLRRFEVDSLGASAGRWRRRIGVGNGLTATHLEGSLCAAAARLEQRTTTRGGRPCFSS
jgi:hypothetical protein